MKQAYFVDVKEYACDEYGIIFVKRYSDRKSKDLFKFEIPTNYSFGGEGRFLDPFEAKYLLLSKSLGMHSL